MKYARLGNTDLEVSIVCLGTMTFGEQNSEREAHEQLDYALARGVNFIDTAEMYSVPAKPDTQGRTEEYIGSWLATRHNRHGVIIATKVAGPAERLAYIRGGPRLDRSHINRAIDASLRRLRTDYVDLYQIHWPERSTNFFGQLGYECRNDLGIPLEETLDALAQLVQAGKARYIGVSNETAWGIGEYLRLSRDRGLPRIVTVQNPYNLLNRTFEIGLAEFSHRENLGLLAYSPLAMGALSGKYLGGRQPPSARLTLFPQFDRYASPRCQVAIESYVALAKRCGLDPAQMALAFVNTRPFLASNIIGATTLEQLRANLSSADLTLPVEVLKAIDAIHLQQPNPAP